MEKEITGLCSASVFSSSFQIGFGLIARRIILHSHTSQTNLDNMALWCNKRQETSFLHLCRLLCHGKHLAFNTWSSWCFFQTKWWVTFMVDVLDWCFYGGFVGYGKFGIFQLLDRRGRVHVSGLICLCFILTGNYCVPKSVTVCIQK